MFGGNNISKKTYLNQSGKKMLDIREKERLQRLETKKKQHKCNGCEWGTWEGNKMVCMFHRCFKNT